MAEFSLNAAAQPIYTAIHQVIGKLSREQTLEFLEGVASHVEEMIEGIGEKMNEE